MSFQEGFYPFTECLIPRANLFEILAAILGILQLSRDVEDRLFVQLSTAHGHTLVAKLWCWLVQDYAKFVGRHPNGFSQKPGIADTEDLAACYVQSASLGHARISESTGSAIFGWLSSESVDFVSNFAGESQIVTAHGETLARRSGSQGEGIVVADVPLEKCRALDTQGQTFWLPSLPPVLEGLWYEQGAIGRQYYLQIAVPHRRARNASS